MIKIQSKFFSLIGLNFLLITIAVINFGGCGSYSFTGASIPPHIKTIAIPVSNDRSGAGQPGLPQMLTDKLTQKFIEDNTLQVTDRQNANAILESSIISISDAPAIVQSGENVARRRITVTVQAAYKDLVKRKTIFEKNFSEYSDYPADSGLDIRNSAIEDAINLITEDILLATVSGW